jgi:hypothetical protein
MDEASRIINVYDQPHQFLPLIPALRVQDLQGVASENGK